MKQSDKISKDEMHDLVIDMINEIEQDMEIYEIKEKPFKKRNKSLRPSMAYRTADLLSYMYEKCNKESKRLQAIHILEECFQQCTLTALYYINLDDLKLLINYHKEKNIWRIQFIKDSGIGMINSTKNFLNSIIESLEKDIIKSKKNHADLLVNLFVDYSDNTESELVLIDYGIEIQVEDKAKNKFIFFSVGDGMLYSKTACSRRKYYIEFIKYSFLCACWDLLWMYEIDDIPLRNAIGYDFLDYIEKD